MTCRSIAAECTAGRMPRPKPFYWGARCYGGGSPSARAAHGSAVRDCASWSGRTCGASGKGSPPAREQKKPATHAASSGASGRIDSGGGPPSAARLGNQNATSRSGLASRAWFQSMTIALPSRKHRLSLRMSRWTSDSPARGAFALASMRRGSAAPSHVAEQRPRPRNGAGIAATRRQSAPSSGLHAGGRLVALSRGSPRGHRGQAATRSAVQGGGHSASDRSSSASAGRWPSSSKPSIRGMKGPRMRS